MTKKRRKKLWSVPRIRDPRYPDYTLRVTELKRGGNLYIVHTIEGKQKMRSLGVKRTDLGTTAKEQEDGARAEALEVIAALAAGGSLSSNTDPSPEPGESLTLGSLADLYEKHGLHGRSEKYRREQPAKVRRIAAFLGEDRGLRSLCKTDVEAYSAHREENDGVRQGTIASDLHALKIALNWATEHKRKDGSDLLEDNPIEKIKIEKETQPRRPVAGEERYQALKSIAHKLPPAFDLALDLVWGTGHRIGAVRRLTWGDILFEPEEAALAAAQLQPEFCWNPSHFPRGGIRWYAGRSTNKKVHEHVTPMNDLTREALESAHPDIISPEAPIFPAPKNSEDPMAYSVLRDYMKRAEKLAKIPHIKGGLWHPFRRGWATRLKQFPSRDVAWLGGWRDTATMERCYAMEDPETILAVVNAD